MPDPVANGVDRLDQARRSTATQVIKCLVGPQHGEIGGRVALRHQPRQRSRQLQLAADDLLRMQRDGPGVDGPRQRMAFTVDNVASGRDQDRHAELAAGMVAERRQPQDAQDNESNDPGIDDHREHQPLLHDRQPGAAVRRDEAARAGRREQAGRVHRAEVGSLAGGQRRAAGSCRTPQESARAPTGRPMRSSRVWSMPARAWEFLRPCRPAWRGWPCAACRRPRDFPQRRRAAMHWRHRWSPGREMASPAGAAARTTGASITGRLSGRASAASWKPPSTNWSATRRQANEPGVPAFELGEPSARSDLRLQHPDVALGEDDLFLDPLQLGALGGDVERHQIASERRANDAGRHEYRPEALRAHACPPWSHAGASVRTAVRNRAERARGFLASSRSEGATGLATFSNVGAGPRAICGRWRDPAGRLPLRSLRKRLTMRSSSCGR